MNGQVISAENDIFSALDESVLVGFGVMGWGTSELLFTDGNNER